MLRARLLVGMPRGLKHWLVAHHSSIRLFLPRGNHVYVTRVGRMFLDVRESPMMLARALSIRDERSLAFFRNWLEPGDYFLDVGANRGEFSILGAQAVGREGVVFAFEPFVDNLYWLVKNVKLNRLLNVSAFGIAVSDHEGISNLYLGNKSGWHSLQGTDSGAKGTVPVRVASLDSLMGGLDAKRLKGIKIDVEGCELEVLKGARSAVSGTERLGVWVDVHPTHGVRASDVAGVAAELGLEAFNPITGRRVGRGKSEETPSELLLLSKGYRVSYEEHRGVMSEAVPRPGLGIFEGESGL